MSVTKDSAVAPEGAPIGEIDDSAKTLSLMGGIVRPEGLPEAEEFQFEEQKIKRKVLTQGTMLILVIFVIAAGTIWGMRVSQRSEGPSKLTQEHEAKIDNALKRLSSASGPAHDDPINPANIKKLFKDTDSIVSMFSTDPTKQQVPIDKIKKNPFVLPLFQSTSTVDAGFDARRSQEADRKHREKLERELEGFDLQSVMNGAMPVAIINNDLLQPGQEIGSFTIKAINDVSVKLESRGGMVFMLEMQDKTNKRSGRNGRSYR